MQREGTDEGLSGHQRRIDMAAVRTSFDDTSAGISRLAMNDRVLRQAEGSFPLVIRTLDAIHLATAEEWSQDVGRQDVAIWSLDRQMNRCAGAMGFQTPLL